MQRRWIALFLAIVLCACGCSVRTSTIPQSQAVLVDPGHGGPDGGAVAEDGTLEKDINLAISLYLRDFLAVSGVPVAITRESDMSLHSEDAVTIREKKISDLHHRLALYEQSALVISIHQNRFEQPQYRGAQVFYSDNNADSAPLSQALQNSIIKHLQPDNKREVKAASDNVFLMYHTTVPAVLVECGFLSNPQELALLKDDGYRREIAWAILIGYWNYSSEK